MAAAPARGASRSRAGDGIAVLDACRQGVLAPRGAGVLGAEHLAATRYAIHPRGIARVHGYRHHGAARLHASIETSPAPAHVFTPVERAVVTTGGHRQARVQDARV